jgi:hypothetical protein
MKRLIAYSALVLLASGISAVNAKPIWDTLNESAPRSVFEDIQDTAPRTIFDEIKDTSPVRAPETEPTDLIGE